MKAKYLLMGLVCVMTCSCSSIRHTSTQVPVDTKVVSFTVADMDVQPTKVSATTSWNFNPFKKVNIGLIKTNTTAQMLNNANADVLLEPQYIIENRGFLRGGSVTVIGFPATYKNFHKMTTEEAEIFKAIDAIDQNKASQKKKFFFF